MGSVMQAVPSPFNWAPLQLRGCNQITNSICSLQGLPGTKAAEPAQIRGKAPNDCSSAAQKLHQTTAVSHATGICLVCWSRSMQGFHRVVWSRGVLMCTPSMQDCQVSLERSVLLWDIAGRQKACAAR